MPFLTPLAGTNRPWHIFHLQGDVPLLSALCPCFGECNRLISHMAHVRVAPSPLSIQGIQSPPPTINYPFMRMTYWCTYSNPTHPYPHCFLNSDILALSAILSSTFLRRRHLMTLSMPCSNYSFQWQTKGISYLGVSIPANLANLFSLNYVLLFSHIRKDLECWGEFLSTLVRPH